MLSAGNKLLPDQERRPLAKAYYIRVQGRVQGPLSCERIQLLIKRRQFGRMHEISEDGKNWLPAANVPELFREPPELTARQRPVARPQPADCKNSGVPTEDSPNQEFTEDWAVLTDADVETLSLAEGWYYLADEKTVGPVAIGEIQDLLRSGALPADTFVWHATLSDWAPAQQVAEMALASSTPQLDAPASSGSLPVPATAVPSLIFGILGILVLPIIGGVVAVVFGHLAITAIRRGTAKSESSSTAIIGLVLGYAGIALWVIVILATILFTLLRH
jgi:hypothetical protein